MTTPTVAPYVVGQWVRGERFYGRDRELREILEGPRDALWVLGTRRIGKTSLLKHLEHLTSSSPRSGYFPVFWDLEGSDSAEELHLGFQDALLDAEDRLDEAGIGLPEVEAGDLFVSLGRLRRRLRAKGLRLLLLCDEAEELLQLQRRKGSLLGRLRRALQAAEGVRTVLASTLKLWKLAETTGDTSPFLHGFTPPLYLRGLEGNEHRGLILQDHEAIRDRPDLTVEMADEIRRRCGSHPYLLQIVCKRFLEEGSLDDAIEQVAVDRMVSHFFAVDFEMLSVTQQEILRVVGDRPSIESRVLSQVLGFGGQGLTADLLELESLGFLGRSGDQGYGLGNDFFRRWLAELPRQPTPPVGREGHRVPARSGGPRYGALVDPGEAPTVDAGLDLLEGRYQLLRELGVGATGQVFLAYDRLLRVRIAVKLLKQEFAEDDYVLERFRQEIVLSRDLGHPNILRVYHLGQHDGQRYLTMQWVDGPTLAELLVNGPLPESIAVEIGAKLASALAAAHDRGILHRDIKPQNVLMEGAREPLITDFGLAREAGGPEITLAGVFVGTPYYTSPEQAALTGGDARSDIYSLGVVLFEMATGSRPFDGADVAEVLAQHRDMTPPAAASVNPDLSVELSRVISQSLAKSPSDRFADAHHLFRALQGILKDGQE